MTRFLRSWPFMAALAVGVALMIAAASPASADSYYIWDDWGGTWSDAEKTSDNTDDDLLCWAGAASNILEWTGWGQVGGMTDTDDMFAHFQTHFTDLGGSPYYAWDWWFDGTNDVQGVPGWAQVDVAGGGGFYPLENIDTYRVWSGDDATVMATIDSYLRGGYGTSLWIGTAGGGAHLITVWGIVTDQAGAYTGLYVTDSDDSKGGLAPRPNLLQQYDVQLSGGKWFLQDYYGTDTWFIGEAMGLAQNPNAPVIPEPLTLALAGFGLAGLAAARRRRAA